MHACTVHVVCVQRSTLEHAPYHCTCKSNSHSCSFCVRHFMFPVRQKSPLYITFASNPRYMYIHRLCMNSNLLGNICMDLPIYFTIAKSVRRSLILYTKKLRYTKPVLVIQSQTTSYVSPIPMFFNAHKKNWEGLVDLVM